MLCLKCVVLCVCLFLALLVKNKSVDQLVKFQDVSDHHLFPRLFNFVGRDAYLFNIDRVLETPYHTKKEIKLQSIAMCITLAHS